MTALSTRGCTGPARQVLAPVADRDDAFRTLLDRSREFDDLLGTEFETPPGWVLPPSWLRAGPATRVADADTRRAVASLVGDADPEMATALSVVLARGLVARGALGTVPREALFDETEVALLDAVAMAPAPVTTRVDLRQDVGRPLDYTGYLCAIVKLTRLCNLRCTYCHDWRTGPEATMGFPMQVRTVQEVLSCGAAAVDVVWHGGEPLLMGARGLLRFLSLQQIFAAEGQIVRNHAQSNGAAVTEAVRRVLRLFDVKVSVSLDGPPEVHDLTRRDVRGTATSQRVLAGVRELAGDGLLSGVIVVVTPEVLALGAARMWEFLEDVRPPSVSFLAERPAPGDPPRVTKADFVGFLLEVEVARRRVGSTVLVRELDAVRRLLEGRQSGFCELAGNCVGSFVSVDPDGAVSHCDKYLGDETYVLGSLTDQSLRQILAGPRTVAIRRAAQDQLDSLRACPHFRLCQGWCPHERYVDGTFAEAGCCGLAPLFEQLSVAAPVAV